MQSPTSTNTTVNRGCKVNSIWRDLENDFEVRIYFAIISSVTGNDYYLFLEILAMVYAYAADWDYINFNQNIVADIIL